MTTTNLNDIFRTVDWVAHSGEPVTGEQAATHLEATLDLLEEHGWTRYCDHSDDTYQPDELPDETWSLKAILLWAIREIRAYFADNDDPQGPLTLTAALYGVPSDLDTTCVANRCLKAIIQRRTDQNWVDPHAWATKHGRTYEQIRGLLQDAIAFAREHGPTA